MEFYLMTTIAFIFLVLSFVLAAQKNRLEQQVRSLNAGMWNIWQMSEFAKQRLEEARINGNLDLTGQSVLTFLFANLDSTFMIYGRGRSPFADRGISLIPRIETVLANFRIDDSPRGPTN